MKRSKGWRPIILVVVVVGLVVGGWYFARQSLSTAYPQAYGDWADKLQSAVDGYSDGHGGDLPLVSYDAQVVIDGDAMYIIDICALLNEEFIIYLPDNCVSVAGNDNDNCDGGNCSCYDSAHYIWALDSGGGIRSTCIGEGCDTSGNDGYQGVWP